MMVMTMTTTMTMVCVRRGISRSLVHRSSRQQQEQRSKQPWGESEVGARFSVCVVDYQVLIATLYRPDRSGQPSHQMAVSVDAALSLFRRLHQQQQQHQQQHQHQQPLPDVM